MENKKDILRCESDLPKDLKPVLAIIQHQNDLGLSEWYEVIYYDNRWCSFNGSETFNDGEIVIKWKYCDECI